MANTIKIKRRPASGAAGKPSSLYNGELAFNENDNILYYGYGSGVGGAASTIEQIGGSGYFAHRGGINASGTWPISVTGNSATVTNGVYTTGDQNVGGAKTFTAITTISGNLSPYLLFKSANAGNYGNIVFDGVNYAGAAQSSYIASNTGNMEIAHGQKIQLNSALEVKAANTSGNSVGYFAVFDSNPASSLTTLKSVSKDQILDDIGAATSGLNITAGSGLVGGGTLSTDRRFDVGQGDGISVSADSIAVNSTVVRTTNGGIANHIAYWNSSSGIIADSGQLYWDASNDRLGIGTSSPSGSLDAAGAVICRGDGESIKNLINAQSDYSGPHGVISWYNAYDNAGVVGDIASIQVYTDNSPSQGVISFSTRDNSSPSEKMRILANGNVGIATTSPTEKLHVDGKGLFSSGVNISNQTANTIASFDGSKNVVSLSTSTYPSLTELSYVKGVTSAVQTQLDNRIIRPSSTTSGNIPIWTTSSGTNLGAGYSVETTLSGSSSSIPRADAVKTYVDNMITSGIATNDAMIFKGSIDCSANPNYPAADRGWTYKVSVAGKIGGASGPTVEVNDTLICTTDSTSAGTHAAVGSNWVILQTNIVDASILVTGPASATSGNIAIFDGSTGKIIKDGGFLASNIARLSESQTFTGVNSFGVINAGYQVTADPALTIYNDADEITFRVLSGGTVTYGTWSASTIAADKGGTGQSSYSIGDLLYANTTTSLAKLADVATGNVLLAGGVNTAPSWGKVGLTTHVSGTLPVANGGTNQTSYTDGQLLIGNSTGNTLTKATLTAGTSVDITNGNGSITIGHADTSTLTGAQGSNGIASITVDGLGHVTAVTTATYLTAGTVCAAIVDCSLDGGSF